MVSVSNRLRMRFAQKRRIVELRRILFSKPLRMRLHKKQLNFFRFYQSFQTLGLDCTIEKEKLHDIQFFNR